MNAERKPTLKQRVIGEVPKAYGIALLGVSAIGAHRLATGGSVGRAVVEMGLGAVAAFDPITTFKYAIRRTERQQNKAEIASLGSLGGIFMLGILDYTNPDGITTSGTYEFVTSLAILSSLAAVGAAPILRSAIHSKTPDGE